LFFPVWASFPVCHGNFKAGHEINSLSKVRKILALRAAVTDLFLAHLAVQAAQG
jgi:hypothetical protein